MTTTEGDSMAAVTLWNVEDGCLRPIIAGAMHKSYQSFHPCGNKLLQKRWDDSTFSGHRQRVYRLVADSEMEAVLPTFFPLFSAPGVPSETNSGYKGTKGETSRCKQAEEAAGGRGALPLTVERAATDTNRLTFFLPTIAHEGKELRGRSRQPALVAQDATHDGSWQRCRVQENLHAS